MRQPRRRRQSGPRASGLPDRAAIVEFVNSSPRRIGQREIARAFNVKGADRAALRDLLRDMKDEGLLGSERRAARVPGSLPPVGVASVADVDHDGGVSVVPAGEGASLGPIPLHGLKGAPLPALGPGDRVLVRYAAVDGEEAQYEARLIRRLPSGQRRTLAIVSGPSRGPWRATPVAKRARDDIEIDPAGIKVADGDLVTVELAGGPRRATPRGRVVEHHGRASGPRAVSLIAIHEHEIPDVFSDEALEEARNARAPGLEGRTDLRALPFVTIDPADARDHDDAVHAAPDPDERNPDGWIVHVAIADVAHFVRPGSALDREARTRGNSVYFPDRVVPMLPEELSADLCSLKAGEERAVLVVRMVFDAAGALKKHAFERAIIVSRGDLNYEETQAAIDGDTNETTAPLLGEVLRPLWAAYEVLSRARDKRGPLELDLPERRIILDDKGVPTGVVTPARLDAHRLIEEFMIQANVATAEALERARSPFLRRVHDAPAPEKIDGLAAFLASLELRLPRGQVLSPAHFNRLIEEAAETAHAEAVSDAVLRAQSQAHYAARDLGHFGLNLRRYAHYTSPIRRYADIVAHRALISALKLGPDGLDREMIASLDEIGAHISEAERRAMAAERDTSDRLIAQFLSSRVGASFSGRVAGIVRSGLFVELDETGANGFVASADLGRAHDDYFAADEASRSLVGETTGRGYRMGERVEVRLAAANAISGALDFDMLTPPKKVAQAAAGKRRGRRARG